MRVFVLNTGRCGSTTFARSCQHMENYSVSHESLANEWGNARFDYPDQHIEVDNRLAWFLGHLGDFDSSGTAFVHLRRDSEATARSFLRRWRYSWRSGIIEAFGHAIVMHPEPYDKVEKLELCRFYVDTVNANIEAFLRTQTSHLEVRLETAREDFARFWTQIGAEGDLLAALDEWDIRHNASRR